MELQDGKITFVGTNTHRLSIKTMEQESSEAMSMIIPSRVLSEIARNLTSELPQEVKLSLLNNQIMVQIDKVVIVSRLIEGNSLIIVELFLLLLTLKLYSMLKNWPEL